MLSSLLHPSLYPLDPVLTLTPVVKLKTSSDVAKCFQGGKISLPVMNLHVRRQENRKEEFSTHTRKDEPKSPGPSGSRYGLDACPVEILGGKLGYWTLGTRDRPLPVLF